MLLCSLRGLTDVKRSECHSSTPFQLSPIEFAIEQESDCQPLNDMLLISFCYSSFKLPFTALSKCSSESEVSIMCHGLLCHLLRDPEIPNTKCMGEFATLHQFRPF